jgi:hypothetical protein
MDKINENKSVEFDEPKVGKKYRMEKGRLTINNNVSSKYNLVIDDTDVLDVLTACVDYIKRYGVRDNYGREINTENLFKVIFQTVHQETPQ